MSFYQSVSNSRSRDLSDADIMRVAPSVFAAEASSTRSERYRFIPTSAVLGALRNEGFTVAKVSQSRARLDANKDFTKHQLRFRKEGFTLPRVGGVFPELILTNAHDGTSAYNLEFGLYRLVCSNGLTVREAGIDAIKVRHSGPKLIDDVIEGSYRVIDASSDVGDRLELLAGTPMPVPVQREFARAALSLRWDEGEAPIDEDQLLRPRRIADQSNDVFTVFNRVQEGLIKGGLHGRTGEGKRTTTREVRSIDKLNGINRSLWAGAVEVALALK